MKSETVIIKNPHTENEETVARIMKRIRGYLTAQSKVMLSYLVQRESLAAATQVGNPCASQVGVCGL